MERKVRQCTITADLLPRLLSLSLFVCLVTCWRCTLWKREKRCVSDLTLQTFSPDWAAKKQPVVIFCLKYGWLFVLHKSKNVFWALVIYEPRLLLFLENCLVYFFHQITNLCKRMFGHSKGRHVCLWFRQKFTGTFTVKQV